MKREKCRHKSMSRHIKEGEGKKREASQYIYNLYFTEGQPGGEVVVENLKGMSLDEPFFIITIIITRPLATLWRVF